MKLFKPRSRTLKNFLTDTAGSFAMVWAVVGGAVIISVGAAYDVSQVSKAKQIAQMAADNMALTASIAVDTGNENRYEDGQNYTYKYLGGPTDDFTDSMVGVVEYDVDDDGDGESNLLARATVSGTYQTAFAAALGLDEISFSASSDVAYAQVKGTPASVFFAVDNSGSMGWGDATGANKLRVLADSMTSFMTTLETINNDANDIYRTAIWPYSQDYNNKYPYIEDNGIISNFVVPTTWGSVTNGDITRMEPQYGTDSSGALETAAAAFVLEDAIHLAKNGEEDPIKFLIFMSDGANNPNRVCPIVDEYWLDTYRHWNTPYYSRRSWFDRWVIHYPTSGGPYTSQPNCPLINVYESDERSLAACTAMKDAGVTIYTVGYYLVARSNGVSQDEVDRAQALLSGCATDAEHYILASDADDLNLALEAISERVMTEVIRVKR